MTTPGWPPAPGPIACPRRQEPAGRPPDLPGLARPGPRARSAPKTVRDPGSPARRPLQRRSPGRRTTVKSGTGHGHAEPAARGGLRRGLAAREGASRRGPREPERRTVSPGLRPRGRSARGVPLVPRHRTPPRVHPATRRSWTPPGQSTTRSSRLRPPHRSERLLLWLPAGLCRPGEPALGLRRWDPSRPVPPLRRRRFPPLSGHGGRRATRPDRPLLTGWCPPGVPR